MFRKSRDIEDVTAAELRKMLKECPGCEGDLARHEYSTFAMTVATDERSARLIEFFAALKEHRWQEAKGFQEFEGRHNAAEAMALRCVSGSLVVLIIRNPQELYESSSILAHEVLNPEDSKELNIQIEPDRWRWI